MVAAVGAYGFDSERIASTLDARAAGITQQLVGACSVSAPSLEQERERICLGLVWRENLARARAIGRNGSRAQVADAIDGLARVLPAARCSEGNPPSQPPGPTAAQAADDSLLLDRIDAAAQHQGTRSIEQLDALRPAVERNGYVGLALAWSSAVISELVFAGDSARARREVESARHLAQVSGADVQLGWLAVSRLRMATATQTATDEIEADLDAIQTRVGSPLLTAEALQARAERAYTGGQPQRAVELLTAAIALYAEVSLIPAPGLRTAYLTRAASLQQLGALDQAQADLERALGVARQRFTPGAAELEETAGARANNLLYLGKLDEAGAEFRRLRDGMTAAHRDRTATAARIDLSLCQIELVQESAHARTACELAVTTGVAVYGARSTGVIAARNALAQALLETDRAEAIAILEGTLRIGARGGAQPLDVPYAEALLALAYHASKRHADGCEVAVRALAVLRTSPQVDMLKALDDAFPELRDRGHCARR